MSTIVLTGGHLSPLVATIARLKTERKWNLCVLGRPYTFKEAKHHVSFEKETVKAMGVQFYDLDTPRSPTEFSVSSMLFPLRFIQVVHQVFLLMQRIRPSLVISFGGYVGTPVVIAARLLGIPILIHDQTLVPGRATRYLAHFADAVLLSWEQAYGYFPHSLRSKLYLTGNPIRKEILDSVDRRGKNVLSKQFQFSPLDKSLPLLYITGGSTGAHAINSYLADSLEELTSRYRIIHQCGESQYNDYAYLMSRADALSPSKNRRYRLVQFIKQTDAADIVTQADIIVSRAGANTICEIALLGKVAVLIPLPYSIGQEQAAHALLLEQAGSAVVLNQQTLSSKLLIKAIDAVMQSLTAYQKKAIIYAQSKEILYHKTALDRIVDVITTLIDRRGRISSQST